MELEQLDIVTPPIDEPIGMTPAAVEKHKDAGLIT